MVVTGMESEMRHEAEQRNALHENNGMEDEERSEEKRNDLIGLCN